MYKNKTVTYFTLILTSTQQCSYHSHFNEQCSLFRCCILSETGRHFNSIAAFQPIWWQTQVSGINYLAILWHLFQCKCIYFKQKRPIVIYQETNNLFLAVKSAKFLHLSIKSHPFDRSLRALKVWFSLILQNSFS